MKQEKEIMKVIVCPDSYKGTMSAFEAAEAMKSGIHAAIPDADVRCLPIGDGGEGTVDAIRRVFPAAEMISVETVNALGRPVSASYIMASGRMALIESAAASGLAQIPSEERDVMHSDTFGTGLLIADAVERGAKEIVVCMGGTATCDGGYGAYRALRNLDLDDISFTLLCDVENPFCGPQGAARTFGPQKGASPEEVEILDRRLRALASEYAAVNGVDVSAGKFAGAAGGLSGMLMACYGARSVRGIERVLEMLDFRAMIAGVDAVVTGEGKADATTLCGKAPMGVLDICREAACPVILVGGRIDDEDLLLKAGFAMVKQATPNNPVKGVSPEFYLREAVKAIFQGSKGSIRT